MNARFWTSCLGLAVLIIAAGVLLGVGLSFLMPAPHCAQFQVLEPPLSGHLPECLP